MPEIKPNGAGVTPTPNPVPGNGTSNNDNSQGGTPANNNGEGNAPFDPSTLSDAEFEKIFGDPRLFKHSRFSNLNERAKKADELEKLQKQQEEAKLKEQGEYQKLAETKEAEANTWKQKYENSSVNNKIAVEAMKLGCVDVDAAIALIDKSNVKVNEDGTITGLSEALETLQKGKAYLFGKPTQVPNIGGDTNPGDTSTIPRFKASQLKDVAFFRTNEKAIMEAMRLGLIENDLPGQV